MQGKGPMGHWHIDGCTLDGPARKICGEGKKGRESRIMIIAGELATHSGQKRGEINLYPPRKNYLIENYRRGANPPKMPLSPQIVTQINNPKGRLIEGEMTHER